MHNSLHQLTPHSLRASRLALPSRTRLAALGAGRLSEHLKRLDQLLLGRLGIVKLERGDGPARMFLYLLRLFPVQLARGTCRVRLHWGWS